jgi:putative mRNA 3-end processing factor
VIESCAVSERKTRKRTQKKRGGRTVATPESRPAVEWREGVHILGTPIWCDALHTREVCFVSSAAVPEAHRHRQIIATADTVALLPTTARKRPQSTLTPPYARPFSLGELRVELYPSGFIRGAASFVVDVRGERVAYAGALAPAIRQLDWQGQVRPCDVLIVDASYAHPRFRFAPPAMVAAEVEAFVSQVLADGGTPVLLAPPLTLAMTLIARLGARVPLVASRSIAEAAARLRQLAPELPPVRRMAGSPRAGEAVLWPIAQRDAKALTLIARPRFALVDASAVDVAAVVRARADTAFAWSDRAGHDDLVDYAGQCGAHTVFAVGGGDGAAAALAPLTARGVRVEPVGRPSRAARAVLLSTRMTVGIAGDRVRRPALRLAFVTVETAGWPGGLNRW